MRATAQGRMKLDMRVYAVDLVGDLRNLRRLKPVFPLVYRNDDYAAGGRWNRTPFFGKLHCFAKDLRGRSRPRGGDPPGSAPGRTPSDDGAGALAVSIPLP